jgi:hypothetical protein
MPTINRSFLPEPFGGVGELDTLDCGVGGRETFGWGGGGAGVNVGGGGGTSVRCGTGETGTPEAEELIFTEDDGGMGLESIRFNYTTSIPKIIIFSIYLAHES